MVHLKILFFKSSKPLNGSINFFSTISNAIAFIVKSLKDKSLSKEFFSPLNSVISACTWSKIAVIVPCFIPVSIILKDFSLTIYPGDKIALIGPNEIAKTTLLNILAGKLDPDSGKITVGSNVIISYYPKNHEEYFASNQTLLEWLRNYSENKDETFVRGFLGRMLFSGEDALKNVKVLSGGEKVRAMFSKLMLNRGNVLLLDEPTNHLDIEAITSLNDGLEKFLGVLVFFIYFGSYALTI